MPFITDSELEKSENSVHRGKWSPWT